MNVKLIDNMNGRQETIDEVEGVDFIGGTLAVRKYGGVEAEYQAYGTHLGLKTVGTDHLDVIDDFEVRS